MSETTRKYLAVTNGNGGIDYKKVALWIAGITISLITVIYAKDTTDVAALKDDVDSLKTDTANVNTRISVIETKVTSIEKSQSRLEASQEKMETKIEKIYEAVVSSRVRDTSGRNP